MVEHDLPKVETGVRFPSLAQGFAPSCDGAPSRMTGRFPSLAPRLDFPVFDRRIGGRDPLCLIVVVILW